jgi:hypothetical protein
MGYNDFDRYSGSMIVPGLIIGAVALLIFGIVKLIEFIIKLF